MNKILLLLTLFSLFSCSDRKADLILGTFSEIPEEIDGCGCYFYLSQQDLDHEKYVFVNDFSNYAFININNRVEKFELKEHDERDNTYIYSNEQYDLKVIITKKYEDEEESSKMEGEIILSGGDIPVKKRFIGNCGC